MVGSGDGVRRENGSERRRAQDERRRRFHRGTAAGFEPKEEVGPMSAAGRRTEEAVEIRSGSRMAVRPFLTRREVVVSGRRGTGSCSIQVEQQVVGEEEWTNVKNCSPSAFRCCCA